MPALDWLIVNGSPAARLFAYGELLARDPAAAEVHTARLLRDTAIVETASVDVHCTRQVATIARRIALRRR